MIGVSEAVTMAVTVAVVGAARLVLAADRRAAAARPGSSVKLDRGRRRSLRRRRRARAGAARSACRAFYESFLYLVFHWIVLATSWNILSGYSGYFSFGHGAFFGAGMYTTAVLAARYDVPFLWTLPVAGAIAALLGARARAPSCSACRRVRGELFALLTLAVTFVLGDDRPQHADRRRPRRLPVRGAACRSSGRRASSTFYLLALALALATRGDRLRVIARARLGLGLFAIHDDEDVAEVMGVPTFRYKLAAFALSCALAGVAGGIHALFVSYVTVGETFSITVPLTVVLMSVLGGTRHWAGPAIGAAVITALLYAFTAGDHAIAGKAVVRRRC